MSPRLLHIVGTDTDVGKSYITHQLLKLYSKTLKIIPLKPVHSGWPKNAALGEDLELHKEFIRNFSANQLCRYHFEAPTSPHYAANKEGSLIELKELNHFIENAKQLNCDQLLIEGIGGIHCPLAPKLTYLDFLKANPAPTILVSRVGLGSLNHSLLSYFCLKSAGIPVKALILNMERDYDSNDEILNSAKWELESQIDCSIIGPLPRNNENACCEILNSHHLI